MQRLSLIGIFLGILLLLVAIPQIDALRVLVVDAGTAAPIPAIFATFLVLTAIAVVGTFVFALANRD